MIVVGADGCPGGRWVLVTWDQEPKQPPALSVDVVDSLDEAVASVRAGLLDALAIDMPIGLLDADTRQSDKKARQLLGQRRSSVFPTPVRGVLGAVDYHDACQRSREAIGKALSKQTFNILDRIETLDALITPGDQDRIVEAHPELAFMRLNGEPLPHAKQRPEGRAARRRLLTEALTAHGAKPATLATLVADAAAPEIDVLDAAALAISARRVAVGDDQRIGTEVDQTGLRCQVTF